VENIKVDVVEIGWGGVDWIGVTQDRYRWKALMNAVMNFLEFHKMEANYRVATQLVGFPSSAQLDSVS
jgi:hypothetical protein